MICVLGQSPARGYEQVRLLVGLVGSRMCQTGRRWVWVCGLAGVDWEQFVYENAATSPDTHRFDAVICLGTAAAKHYRGHSRVLAIPHPSGRNRFWNDPEAMAQVASSLKQFLEVTHG